MQFMNIMNDLLGDYLAQFILVFFHNILVYFANDDEHADQMENILQVLLTYQIYVKASKYEMYGRLVEFLG